MIYSKRQGEVLLQANARYNILGGAVRSGKTHISYDLILKRRVELPEGARWLIGKTERTLRRNVLDPMRDRFGADQVSDIYGAGLVKLFGKRYYVAGANDVRAVNKIRGAGMISAYGDEVASWDQNFFRMLQSRLDKKESVFDGTCNPESPHHWLKKDIIDKPGVDCKYFHFRLDDGAEFLDPSFIKNLKAEYAGVWYKRMVDGLWVLAQGSIYDMWRDEDHIIDKLTDIPEFSDDKEDEIVPDYWGASIDAATSSVCTFGLYGVKGDICWQEKEYYYDARKHGKQKTDYEYSRDFADFVNGYGVRSIYVDPAASSLRAALRADGFSVVRNAINSVLPGIQTVSRKLLNKEFFVRRNCTETIREKSCYVWDPKQQDKGEDVPLKKDDHCSDRERYFLHSVYGRSKLLALGRPH